MLHVMCMCELHDINWRNEVRTVRKGGHIIEDVPTSYIKHVVIVYWVH